MLLVAVAACSSDGDDSSAESALAGPTVTTGESAQLPTPDTQASESGPATATEPTDAAPTVVPAALQFSAPLVGGGTFDGAAAAGKPTVFWFWAPT